MSKYKKISRETGDALWKRKVLVPRPQPYEFSTYEKDYRESRNYIRDYLSTMGKNPKESFTPPPHVHARTIRVDNSTEITIGIGINTNPTKAPEPLFYLEPGELRYVLINSYGDTPQYLWPFRGYSEGDKCNVGGNPRILSNNANVFVIKKGVYGFWILTFREPI